MNLQCKNQTHTTQPNYNNAFNEDWKMTQKVWLGRIYLKEEGGYEIILKSLCHYKNRLKTLGSSPEVQDSAAMFASVLNQQARKTVPKIEKTIKKIQAGLNDSRNIGELEEDISFFEKACNVTSQTLARQKIRDMNILQN